MTKWRKVFGIEWPKGKISGTKLSRFVAKSKGNVCVYCFPHGPETPNSHMKNAQKSWKKFRLNQYKTN